MNNHQIEAAMIEYGPIFRGVFAADRLPKKYDGDRAAYIINTDDAREPGTHWLAVFKSNGKNDEYFDSYGLAPFVKSIENFLSANYIYNDRQIQSLLTQTCGQHCIYFLQKRIQKYSMKEIVNSFSDHKIINDLHVNKNVEKILHTKLDIFHDFY